MSQFAALIFSLAVALPPGTVPMWTPDPVLPVDPGTPAGFGCFEACGPSCACVGRADGSTTTILEDGRTCRWQTVRCNTHAFCRWHDRCYHSCDRQYPGTVDDGSFGRALCYRSCDIACSTGHEPAPVGGWDPPELTPGAPTMVPGIVECVMRLRFDDSVPYDGTITYAHLLGCD